jgi:hypothetical protein
MSRNYMSAQAVWIFRRVVLSSVLGTISIVCQVHRAFEAFDDSEWDLARFVELRICPRCHQFLVPWSRGIEPWLPDQTFEDLDPPELQGY